MNVPTIDELKAKQERYTVLLAQIVKVKRADPHGNIDAEVGEMDALDEVLNQFRYFIYDYVAVLEERLREAERVIAPFAAMYDALVGEGEIRPGIGCTFPLHNGFTRVDGYTGADLDSEVLKAAHDWHRGITDAPADARVRDAGGTDA